MDDGRLQHEFSIIILESWGVTAAARKARLGTSGVKMKTVFAEDCNVRTLTRKSKAANQKLTATFSRPYGHGYIPQLLLLTHLFVPHGRPQDKVRSAHAVPES